MTSLLLRGGRVIDPASGRDEVCDVLVDGTSVAAVGQGLVGDRTLDVTGLVVGPGFVDLHSHVHSVAGHHLQALDGVTTALDLEAGLAPVSAAYERAAAEGRPLHYGFSASWAQARGKVLAGREPVADFGECLALLGNEAWQRSSSPRELAAWLEVLRGELADGALGIGVLMGYAPRSDPSEYVAVARLAAEAGVPTYTHVRELVEADPTTPVDGSSEVAVVAAETGAHMHHCHVNSTSRRHLDRVLATLDRAQREGSRVTVEAYPYGAGSTAVGAFFLAPERLSAWGIRPDSIVLLPSGERIADVARLRAVRQSAPEAECIVEFLDETDAADRDLLHRALAFPDTVVASDAMPVRLPVESGAAAQWPLPSGTSTHPRTAGTFAKAVRTMVRESGDWTWLEAFRRCSYLPARIVDFAVGGAAKGHLGVGADADIVVLDPDAFSDRASYTRPATPNMSHTPEHTSLIITSRK